MNDYTTYLDLLEDTLSENEIPDVVATAQFLDHDTALRRLRGIATHPKMREAFATCLPNLLTALGNSIDPDRALVDFERLTQSVRNPFALFDYLARNPRAAEMLVTVSQGSQFLTEILLRNPEYFERLTDRSRLTQIKTLEQLYNEAQLATRPYADAGHKFDALRRFQRWELLRIGACDFFGLLDLPTITTQLSHLAESIIRVCLSITAEDAGIGLEGFAVLAMGKLGGEELNYSSDIDLLFLASSGANRYQRLGQKLIEALAQITGDGFLYRVDMRLRPWGSVGPLISTVDAYVRYLEENARLWERQALLKARVIAGDNAVGHRFLRDAQPLIFGHAGDDDAVRADVHAMKDRIEAGLRKQGRAWGEVKLGEGSIRDIEFVTQYLQLINGDRYPDVRSPTTLDALSRLSDAGILAAGDERVLTDGYIFLRTVEHYLQLMNYHQTHTLPEDDSALAHLARRLGFTGDDAGEQFRARYEQHAAAIRDVYRQHLLADVKQQEHEPPPSLRPHLTRMEPSYAATFSDAEITRHVELIEQLDDETPVLVDAHPNDDSTWRVTIVGYDVLGELSIITGLFFVYGLNILDGNVFTYEPQDASTDVGTEQPARRHWRRRRTRRLSKQRTPSVHQQRKIVDVFTVEPAFEDIESQLWEQYATDLIDLLRRMYAGDRRDARGELAKRVGTELRTIQRRDTQLYPIDIEINNEESEDYTVLHIEAQDTIGFLYEFTNALAMNRIHIAHVTIKTKGTRVHDVLYVTDAKGEKITSPERQRELRAATVLVKHFTHLLPASPNPETALRHFRELLGHLFERHDWPDDLASLDRPEVLNALARLLGVSDFLWEDFLRMQYDNLFPVVRTVTTVDHRRSRERMQGDLDEALRAAGDNQQRRRDALNAFKDREMFRIDMRYILGHVDTFEEFSTELADLAEIVVTAALNLCNAELQEEHGEPLRDNGERCPLAVLALGKCGGRELGFASDIELMFVYANGGETAGPTVTTASQYFEKLVAAFLQTVEAKREGVFEVDLRLRPYGKAGSLAVPLDAFERYFAPDGPAWPYERQALVKLRPIAGDIELGNRIATLRDDVLYDDAPFDVAAMRAMRERQVRHLVTPGTVNAKHSPGGLVDIEYIVQGLQITHGYGDPQLRVSNTRDAMAALADAGIMSNEQHDQLEAAYLFLRRLIEALRMVRGNARDLTVPPADSEEFRFLARRLHYGGELERLRDDVERHMRTVQELNTALLE